MNRQSLIKKHITLIIARAVIIFFVLQINASAAEPSLKWWKGNLHTHTLWSDGQNYPEMVVEWYKQHGYQFLGLSDHNILSQGQRWINSAKNPARQEQTQKYVERFGKTWVEFREVDGRQQVRVKPLGEFRCLFEEPDRFLLIQAEEITEKKAHIGAVNLLECISPQGGDTTMDVLNNNMNAVLAQQEKTGQLMLAHINHPNFRWQLTAEEIMQVKGEKFFEVYNGHPSVYSYGDTLRAGTDRMWDIILTKRLAELNLPVMYGIATDDAHIYLQWGEYKYPNPGRGWVIVRAAHLTPESIIKAMEAGDFYASTGVVMKDIQFDNKTLKLEIEGKKGVSYTIQFIGTLKGYDTQSHPVKDANGTDVHATQIYSDDIGKVLASVKGTAAEYTLTGNEIYVRAKITSTKLKDNPQVEGEVETAWIQPVVPAGE